MNEVYTVKTEIFEGPLEILLSLIEKRKLFINDISLASVADDYIEYMNTHNSFPLSETAHFILIASTLLLIKSKSLLPTLSLKDEEEQDIEELERRLKLYAFFKKEVSPHIRKHFGVQILFPPTSTRSHDPVFSPDNAITTASINESVRNVLNNLPKKQPEIPKKVVRKVMSLEEVIENLTERISGHLQTSFKEFSGMGRKEKTHIIVSFLAMLELVKQGVIAVQQDELFSDIAMGTSETIKNDQH